MCEFSCWDEWNQMTHCDLKNKSYACCKPLQVIYYNVRPPSDVSWLTKAPVTIVISTINHSYWSYLHQLSYLGGLTLYHIFLAYGSGLNFREYPNIPSKLWPTMWYVYVPPCIGSWRSPIETMFDETRYILRMDAPLSRWNGCWQLSH